MYLAIRESRSDILFYSRDLQRLSSWNGSTAYQTIIDHILSRMLVYTIQEYYVLDCGEREPCNIEMLHLRTMSMLI